MQNVSDSAARGVVISSEKKQRATARQTFVFVVRLALVPCNATSCPLCARAGVAYQIRVAHIRTKAQHISCSAAVRVWWGCHTHTHRSCVLLSRRNFVCHVKCIININVSERLTYTHTRHTPHAHAHIKPAYK